ncbi:hypothetical protein FAEUMB_11010 [Faecalimonas umbilicata]|uniref:Uncharacterized protein n=1 Tax=Faecalimonas umbilicata TaxID=1912855 RepID=A0ABQ0QVW7_9FIRM|nr:hypothetical protein FAEUMB_11010 [Faecalimonas umbilicata]
METDTNIKTVLQHPHTVKSAIYRTRYRGIDIIKGNTGLLERDATNIENLSKALSLVKEKYDICII